MTIHVHKNVRPDGHRWHFARLGHYGQLLENSHDPAHEQGGGYATLAELLDDVKARFPGLEIVGIGGDEPEAEGLSW